ncbi:MAG: hypothetical protein KKB70_07865 [Proteobacteria bacterium]|nr:hypothetical protein [Pseudomonadota bacterium]
MKITFNRDSLIKGLKEASAFVKTRSKSAAFANSFWFEGSLGELVLTATDGFVEYVGRFPSAVVGEGRFGVNADMFHSLIQRMPAGELVVSVEQDETKIKVSQGKRKYELPMEDLLMAPSVSDFPEDGQVAFFAGAVLADKIGRVERAISSDDTMEALACLSIKPCVFEGNEGVAGIEIAGLDGHNFAMIRMASEALAATLDKPLLVHRRYVSGLLKWLPAGVVEIAVSEKRLFFRVKGEAQIVTSYPLSSGNYPNYEGFLSKLKSDTTSLVFSREELLDVLGRLEVFCSDTSRGFVVEASNDTLGLSTPLGSPLGYASEVLSCSGLSSGSLSFALPVSGVKETLSCYKSAKIRLIYSGTQAPCGFVAEDEAEGVGADEGYLSVVMPMQLASEAFGNGNGEEIDKAA